MSTLLKSAVNKLFEAMEEKGVSPTKRTKVDDAVSSLGDSIAATALTMGVVTDTPSESGGTLGAATYAYKVTALNGNGEGIASAASDGAAITGSTGSVAISWTAVTGATSYKVYGRTGGAFNFIAEVETTSYTDDGSVTPDTSKAAPSTDKTALATAAKDLAKEAYAEATFGDLSGKLSFNGSGTTILTEKIFDEPQHVKKAYEKAKEALDSHSS